MVLVIIVITITLYLTAHLVLELLVVQIQTQTITTHLLFVTMVHVRIVFMDVQMMLEVLRISQTLMAIVLVAPQYYKTSLVIIIVTGQRDM